MLDEKTKHAIRQGTKFVFLWW